MRKTCSVLMLLALGGALHAGAANLVVNPGFETGDFSGWTLSGTNSSPSENGIYYGVDAEDAHSGGFGAYFGPIGGVLNLGQTIGTSAGTTYTVSFWLAQSPATPTPYVNSFAVSFGGSAVFGQVGVPSNGFVSYSFSATALSNVSALGFTFRDDTGFFSFDDVSVQSSSNQIVPEPATWLLLPPLMVLTWRLSRRLSPGTCIVLDLETEPRPWEGKSISSTVRYYGMALRQRLTRGGQSG